MRIAAIIIALICATPVLGQPVSGEAARAMIFDQDGLQTQLSGSLNDTERATIKALIPLMARQFRQPVKYYAAIAYAPDEGLASAALQGAFNYHSVEAADRAALSACDAARTSRSPCRLAARVLPLGFSPRALTLNRDATEAFRSRYLRMPSPRALAVSEQSGAWGIGAGEAQARAACGASDCRAVILD